MVFKLHAVWDEFWHRRLGRPYQLARIVEKGSGPPVVLLHGIGRTGEVWKHVIEQLVPQRRRVVAFDLLGFGASPKPKWAKYDIDDHARAVIASLERLRFGQKAVVVGHSMGCLVAVRVARLRPDIVRHLVLYEMPLYKGLPNKRRYRWRVNLYFKVYKYIMTMPAEYDPATARRAERILRRVAGFQVSKASWMPFIKSIENTIMKQTAAEDIKQLKMAMDVIYGSFDTLVIRGKPQAFFGKDTDHITSYTIRAKHLIDVRASKFIAARIAAALDGSVVA